MARPSDNSLRYYNRDTKDDDNLLYVEAVHGLLGYALVDKLWKHIYGCPGGYYCDFAEINQRLFCKNNGVTMDVLWKILETCFEKGIEIFSREKYESHKILTSSGVQKRWLKIVKEAGRKNSSLKEGFRIIEIEGDNVTAAPVSAPGNHTAAVVSEPVTTPKTTQSKRKESKVEKNKIKPNGVAPASLPPAKKLNKKGGEEPEPYWQELVKCWFDFHKSNGLDAPSFANKDPREFKILIQLLKKRANTKQWEWNLENACSGLQYFLSLAFKDDWLSKNFLLDHLVKKFDAVYNRAKLESQQKKSPASSSTPQTFNDEIRYLISRYNEKELDERLINPEYYDKLVVYGAIQVGTLDRQPGATIDDKKRSAVLEFIKTNANVE